VTLSTSAYSALIRNVRLTMINALESNYVMAARARGIPFRSVLLKHAFRNGWVSLITLLGAQLGYMIGGSIVVEYIYNFPGIGLLTLLSVLRRDYPVIQALSLILSMSFVLLNLVVDVSYGFIDPRIRRAQQAE
jgi:ABC-type dipeptide/oligopeptide/nickel transport system permease component